MSTFSPVTVSCLPSLAMLPALNARGKSSTKMTKVSPSLRATVVSGMMTDPLSAISAATLDGTTTTPSVKTYLLS